MPFVTFLAGRIFKALLVIVAIAALNFLLIRLAPGDPASVMAGEAGATDPKYVDMLRARFGLDQPLWKQLALYLGQIVQFDLGFSYRNQVPVIALIGERLPATLLLMASSFVVSLVLGLGLGMAAAGVRFFGRARWLDSAIMSIALIFYATPLFWLALMMVLVFSVQLDWLPAFGMESVGANLKGWARIVDIAQHLVLPTLALSLFFMSVYVRLARAAMMEVMTQDHVRTGFAKGLTGGEVLRRHVFRNALLPIVTFAGIQLGQVAGGAVLIETVFAWPGIGRLMFDALLQRDYQLLLGVFLVTSATVIFFNLLTDIAYRFVDPRIRLEGGAR
ncbi:MAG: peptide/nickel transport system permease [Beijerinckiaceae bacterium]|nr:MAG: peptide/nickel transport system permease [Beijerinckiaceae bacterium]